MTVKITKDISKQVMASIRALTKDKVLVGIPAEHAFREPEPDDPHPDLNNAEIGYLNEFGSPAANIPARPHLVPGVQEAGEKIAAVCKKAGTKALGGDLAAVAAAHTQVGIAASSAVKNKIASGVGPPLAESTLHARKHRKVAPRSGETPLLDTAQYQRNIDFVVVPANQVKKV